MMAVVDVISRGFVGGGLNNNAQKRHLRAVITIENKKAKPDDVENSVVLSLSDDDYLEGFDRDHDDPMVIATTIHNYVVKRNLMDQGSLIDILYSAAVTTMNISKGDLNDTMETWLTSLANKCM